MTAKEVTNMNSTKNYTYTVNVEINLEAIAEHYYLSKNTSLEKCRRCVSDWLPGLDDQEYYVIDNDDEIANDLYDYLQQCNKNYCKLDATQKQGFFKYLAGKYYDKDLQNFDLDCCLEAIGEFADNYGYGWIFENKDFDLKGLTKEFHEYLQKKYQSDRKPLAKEPSKNSKSKKKKKK